MQFLAAFIMKGRLQSIMTTSMLALLALLFFPVNIVSSAAVALVTLRLGGREGFLVLVVSGLAVSLLTLLLVGNFQIGFLYAAMLWGFWLAIWLIAILLREGRRLALTIEATVILGVMVVLAVYLIHPQPAVIWREVLSVALQFMQQSQPDLGMVMDQEALEAMSHMMTGNFTASIVSSLLLGLFLARWWQALLFNPGGFGAEFLTLKGHTQLALTTIAGFAIALLTTGWIGEISRNVVSVLSVLYLFIGIAIMHSVLGATRGRGYLLPLFYVMLVIARPLLGIVLLCGLTDSWLDLRNKFKPNGA